MGLTQAGNLLPQENPHGAERIGRWGVGSAVISGVNAGERILIRNDLVESRRSKILANVLLGTAESLRYPAIPKLRPWCGRRPQRPERGHLGCARCSRSRSCRPARGAEWRDGAVARIVCRNKSDIAEA